MNLDSPISYESSPLTFNHSSPPDSPSEKIRQQDPEIILRRLERPHNQPVYLKDYVCNSVFLTNLTNSCFSQPANPSTYYFPALSTINQKVLNCISSMTEPIIFSQASLHPGWKQAMDSEI